MAVALENSQKIPSVGEFSEDKREKMRMKNQALLAHWLRMEDEERLLGTTTPCSEEDSSEIIYPLGYQHKPWFENVPLVAIGGRQSESVNRSLMHAKKDKVIRLTDVVVILPKVGARGGKGETITGTLEGHVNGFIYTASGFRKHFYFDDIRSCFFRLGGKRRTPLLHFHLHPPLKKRTENTKDIEFHLVKCPPGQNRQRRQKKYDKDSNKIEKGKQNSSDDERIKKFVDEVHARWISLPVRPFLFGEIVEEYEFQGVIHWKGSRVKSATAFALTSNELILLVETPFTVFPLEDIEIVNLALLGPEQIDMTVIFRDFNKEDNVLEVKSIPSNSLADIKDRLNYGNVKYYVNTKELDWKATVKDIAAFPEEFIRMGGWDQYELEDRYTSSFIRLLLSVDEEVGVMKGAAGQIGREIVVKQDEG